MSKQLGPLEIYCDAPPYAVVHACQELGFQTPLDVRWCQMSRFLVEEVGLLDSFSWMFSFGKREPKENTCRCGEPLPVLEPYTFRLGWETVVAYRLAQCRHCRTIYWEEVTHDQ